MNNGGNKSYEKHYSEESFWDKLKKHAIDAGKKVVYSALLCYYAVQNPNVPMKAKLIIYGALGYLILPIDLVPDMVPVLGYGDDLTALLYAIGSIAGYINEDVRTNAVRKMQDWFGDVRVDDKDIIEIEGKIVEAENSINEIAPSDEDDGEADRAKK
nr:MULTISPECIES: YkvA family protein [unclassified Paenibacillus]